MAFRASLERKGIGLAGVGKKYARVEKEAPLVIAGEVERVAKTLAPVDHGRLRGSIESGSDEEGAFVKTNVEYAAFQEFGTMQAGAATDPGPTPEWYQHNTARPGGDPAQPFMRPAFFETVGKVPDIVKRVVSKD